MVVGLNDQADVGTVCYSGNSQAADHIYQRGCITRTKTNTQCVKSRPLLLYADVQVMVCRVSFRLKEGLLHSDLMPDQHCSHLCSPHAASRGC
jgi:hypothetical protein